jgi:hypothetical protein
MNQIRRAAGPLRDALVSSTLAFGAPASSLGAANESNELLHHERTIVQASRPAPAVPPEVARYLEGPVAESRQFDFLIGDWDVAATRFAADGTVGSQYKATWSARALNEGRMIMDDFKALAPGGQAVSSYVTLRTYSAATRRWEMAGLAAFQPAAIADWHGVWTGEEMQLDAVGTSPDGRRAMTRIRFAHIEADRFVWESKTSSDDGKTWTPTASLVATRARR